MKLSKSELASWKQGKQIISDEQLAVCYLIAKCSLNGSFPNFLVKSSISDIHIYSGMNMESLRRTTEKFKILLLGQQEDEEITYKEALYPKVVSAYDNFIEMNIDSIYEIANRSFTEENEKIGLAMDQSYKERNQKYAEDYKKKDVEIKTKVTSLFNTLNSVFNDPTKAKRQAINKISNELNVSLDRINHVWNKDPYLKVIK